MSIRKKVTRVIARDGLRATLKYARALYLFWLAEAERSPNRIPTDLRSNLQFSIVVPCFKSRGDWLLQAVHSVINQTYPHWQLCLGYCELDPELLRALTQLAEKDPRISLTEIPQNLGISGNSNSAARSATGDYVGFLDHDDLLHPDALLEMAAHLSRTSNDLAYSDETLISPSGVSAFLPVIKPDWSPETLLNHNYLCHFTCIRTSLFCKLGGFRSEYDGAQDYDLFLRASEQTHAIGHVRRVLYSWRLSSTSTSLNAAESKPYAQTAAIAAVGAHLRRRGIAADCARGIGDGHVRVDFGLVGSPSVEIVILSANRNGTLVRCMRSLLSFDYSSPVKFHIIQSGDPEPEKTRAALPTDHRVTVQCDTGPFSFSRLCNLAGLSSKADFLLFLNDDVTLLDKGWLAHLVSIVQQEGIGAAGPLLHYPDGTIQHSGLTLAADRIAVDLNSRYRTGSYGFCNRAKVMQNVSAVTGACLCTPTELYQRMGGFDENLPLAYNDVDYCLKLSEAGYRIVYTPYAELVHHESLTRGSDRRGAKQQRLLRERQYMREKWGSKLDSDPYFNFSYFHRQASSLGVIWRVMDSASGHFAVAGRLFSSVKALLFQ